LKRHRRLYESYVPMKYKHYLKKMKRLGEWGDHVTLQAAADRTGKTDYTWRSVLSVVLIALFSYEFLPVTDWRGR
ncbi:UNVERIFIED_CONTAM: OVARIAN TUMOR DOMAIN-containing deubiquitinating enzyme 11, partial [Sesamum latifolium]